MSDEAARDKNEKNARTMERLSRLAIFVNYIPCMLLFAYILNILILCISISRFEAFSPSVPCCVQHGHTTLFMFLAVPRRDILLQRALSTFQGIRNNLMTKEV